MKLSEYARRLGVSYRTAYSYYKSGSIVGAYQLSTGTIIVPDNSEELIITNEMLTKLQIKSHEISILRGKNISVRELIQEAIEKTWSI